MSAPLTDYWAGMLPKSETEAADFVLEHPGWDGRGVVVGILDTGVDPGAIGLQTTSDGKPKVIDIIDCSGSGDIVMSPPIKANDDNTLSGIGGRVLKLNPAWTNPTGEYRVGIKRAFDLYPTGLKKRVTQERQKKWMLKQKNLETNVKKVDCDTDDLKARAELVKSFEKDHEDPGPIYDCVVFHDGIHWQAAVDTTETGDMSTLEPMTDYRIFRQYARFSDLDALNYCVNIFDNGDILSINTDAGAHGSHVAGITAAFHPDNPEQNGVAPGAQIVSLKIGNTRLGSMETSTGLIRALLEAVKRGCHIINMSYGEAAAWDNTGAFVKVAEEMTMKYGVVFVGSAGNNGPALSTMGAPCGTSSCVIAVGALVTNSLIQTAYDTVTSPEKLGETNYTWSSMGPCVDGHSGVSIIAPGGAITCVPNWTLAKNQLMNGTSMSAPNATGCITLLLSAAKANNISNKRLNPMVIRRVVQNFARTLSNVEPLGQGHGLIQVKNAWNNIIAFNPTDAEIIDPWFDVTYEISVNSLRFSRGIYLRQPVEANTATSYKVEIKPVFFNNDEVSPDRLIQFEMKLRVESTVNWIKCPQTLQMHKNGKMIAIDVDPRALPMNKISLGFVFGYDENYPAKGAVFEIPVTVIRPVIVNDNQVTLPLEMPPVLTAGQRERKFFVPPTGCTFIDVIITDKRPRATPISESGTVGVFTGGAVNAPSDDSATRMVCIHALQVVKGEPYEKHEKQQYLHMEPGGIKVVSFPVLEGVTVELCVASYWSTAGDVNVTLDVNFKGVRPSPSAITICGGQRISDIVRVYNPLETTDVAPAAKLDKWRQIIKPSSQGKISPLGERDMMFDGTSTYQFINEYEVDQTEAGEITPRFPALQGILYESSFIGQYFYVYDRNKKVVGVGDAFPKAIKTEKGKHTVVLQVRAESIDALEGLNDMPCLIERALKTSITLSAHTSQTDAARGVSGGKTYPVQHGSTLVLFFKEPSFDALPKNASPGDYLLGSVTYLKNVKSQQGSGTEPRGFPLKYTIGDTKPKGVSSTTSSNDNSAKDDDKKLSIENVETKLSEAVRDSKVKFLSDQCNTPELFDAVADKLLKEYPDHIPLRLTVLTRRVKYSKEKKTVASYTAVVECAEAIVELINQDDLAREFGTNLDKDDSKAAAARKEAETTKASLITALSSKATAILHLNDLEGGSSDDVDLLAETIKSLQKWDDIETEKHWQLLLHKNKAAKHWGLVLKKINELLTANSEKTSKADAMGRDDLLSEQFKCLELLGEDWAHIKHDLEKWARYLKRDSYEAF